MVETEDGVVALITMPEDSAYAAFTAPDASGVRPYVEKVEEIVAGWTSPGADTEEGRAAIKAFAWKIKKSRTAMEKFGFDEAKKAKAVPAKIDLARRFMNTRLEQLEEEVRGPLTKWEADEKARKDAHLRDIALLEDLAREAPRCTVEDLQSHLAQVNRMGAADREEFQEEYDRVRIKAEEAITGAIAEREEQARKDAELAQLRAEKEQRDKAERERIAAEQVKEQQERAAREQEERVRQAEARAAEQARAEERAEAQRQQEASDRADRERERIHREETAARQKEADEQAARERNTRHKGQINRAAAEALTSQTGISTAAAQKIVELIVRGKVPGVSIRY